MAMKCLSPYPSVASMMRSACLKLLLVVDSMGWLLASCLRSSTVSVLVYVSPSVVSDTRGVRCHSALGVISLYRPHVLFHPAHPGIGV